MWCVLVCVCVCLCAGLFVCVVCVSVCVCVCVRAEKSITAKSYKSPPNAEVDDNNNNLRHNEGHLQRSVQAVPGHPQRKKS